MQPDDTDGRLAAGARLIGLALTTASVLNAEPGPGTSGRGLVVTLALVVAIGGWLAWTAQVRDPTVLTVCLALQAAAGGVLTGAEPSSAASAFVFVAVVASGARLPIDRAVAVTVTGLGALGLATLAYDRGGLGLLAYALGVIAGLLVGVGLRQRAERVEQTELLLAQTQRSNEEQLRTARLEESARIAREIHDVLAHALAGLTIQLEATVALIDQGAEPSAVRDRVEQARLLAREGLQETRLAVGALRGDAIDVPAAIAELVGQYRSSTGAAATLSVDGDRARLRGDTGLAVLRIVQEALTNVRKHAPAAAVRVALDAGDGPGTPLVLVVADDGPPAARPDARATTIGGYGLRGMRERAEILGGTLDAGPQAPGWRVELRVPDREGPGS